ncbi:glycosyltransferase family A protein [Chlorogloeopsis sp. ULAP02]|uniref:glycosyltransferase family A protein n=1 Tax=Chlorogloeopsis sp. ULAP02 TaxID=3107926 RepID=UPI0031367D52
MKSLSQEQVKQSIETNLPSFSIVFETENLASVELDNIYRSLASIAAQDISPEQANEFLIIDGGYAPQEVIDKICSKYPWISVQKAPGLGYYEAKMLGATLATGDIIVYCDSDCVYVSNWLRNILTTFLQSSDINVVAGETSTPVRNAYELAIAIHYFFPRFSDQQEPYISDYYFLNAVAFRRDFILQYPIPTNLPLYRGNCDIHCYYFHSLLGNKIWKHPKAQATHEPPTLSFCIWRYLLMGRDRVLKEHIKYLLTKNSDWTDYAQLSTDLNWTLPQKIKGIISIIKLIKPFDHEKILAVLQEDKSRSFFLPLAVPIVLFLESILTIGSIVTYLKSDFLLRVYSQSEDNFTYLHQS